jgi:hypothetical protein
VQARYVLDSFDIEPSFSAQLTVLSDATVGRRTDWKWARVEPPIQAGPHRRLDHAVELSTVAVAPRHVGASFEDGPWPLHVYVCRAIDPATVGARLLTADDLAIEVWATLTPIGRGPHDIPAR